MEARIRLEYLLDVIYTLPNANLCEENTFELPIGGGTILFEKVIAFDMNGYEWVIIFKSK